MHSKWRTKAPAYDLLAHHYLARGLEKHPDIGKHVAEADIGDLDRAPMTRLMALAQEMGIDAKALIEDTEQQEDERRRYSGEFPGFEGVIEFDLTVEMFGQRVTRKARADYNYTPPWPYYDTRKQAVYEGWHGSSMGFEFLNVPEKDGDLGDPTWEKFDILEIGELWNILEDAIEERSKTEDAERRRVSAAGSAAPPRRPRGRRH
jgi:hypothetical protein